MKDELNFYLSLGFTIIPCKKRTKIPLISWRKYQTEKPKDDEIKEWFKDEVNVAVVCGEISNNLVVVDIDSKDLAKRFLREVPEFNKTLSVLTSRGAHFYFQSSKPVKSFKIPAVGIDVKAGGSYVLCPPSLHPDGSKYMFLNRTEPLYIKGDFEEWFWNLVKEKTGYEPPTVIEETSFDVLTEGRPPLKGPHPPCIRRLLDEGAPVGFRNEATCRLASYFKNLRKFSLSKTLRILRTWWKKLPQTPTEFPLSELERTVKHIYKSHYIYGCKSMLPFCDKEGCNLKKETEEKTLDDLLETENKIEIHPLIDYHPEVGYSIGAFVGDKKTKLIFVSNSLFKTDLDFLEVKGDNLKIVYLKNIQNINPDRKYTYNLLDVFKKVKSEIKFTKEARFELVQKLLEKSHYYWYHEDPRQHILVICWAIGTHLYPLFTHYPILHFQGERESGKSTIQLLLSTLVRCPTGRNVSLREAPLFRTIEALRPTFLIDVTSIRERTDIIDLCEACTEIGSVVRRCEGESHKVVDYHTYTPVCLATREEVGFEPKCIRILTAKAPTKAFTKRRKMILSDEELYQLREEIILACLYSWKEVLETYQNLEQTEKLYGRMFDYFSPLLAICKVFAPEYYNDLLSLAEEYALTFSPSDYMVEIENEVLRYLYDKVCDTEVSGIYLKEITNYLNLVFPNLKIGWQKVKSALNNLRVVNRFYHKKDGVFVYLRKDRILEKAKERFEEIEKPAESDEKEIRIHEEEVSFSLTASTNTGLEVKETGEN